MNEAKITRFLAETVMGWKYWDFVGNYEGEIYPMFIMDKNRAWVYAESGGGNYYFDPIHKIEHAFIVLEKIAEMGEFVFIKHDPLRDVHFWTVIIGKDGRADVVNIKDVPEAICIAAVRALATDAQIKEML